MALFQKFVHLFQFGLLAQFLFNTVFHLFLIWIALGDTDLCFSPILVTKPMLLKGKLHQLNDYITNVNNPHTQVMACQ